MMKRLIILLSQFLIVSSVFAAPLSYDELDIVINNELNKDIIFYITYTKPNGLFGQQLFKVKRLSVASFHHKDVILKSLVAPERPHWYIEEQRHPKAVDCLNHYQEKALQPVMQVTINPIGECNINNG